MTFSNSEMIRSDAARVMALGFFDGIHIGHAALMRETVSVASSLDARPAVLTFDLHPDTLVRHVHVPLINSPEDRRYLLKNLFSIDEVDYIHFDKTAMEMPWETFLDEIIRAYSVRHFVVGEDFCFGYRGAGNAEKMKSYCEERGIGTSVIPQISLNGIVVSSTYIRSLLEAGNVAEAAVFLGHPQIISGAVQTGFRIGRTMSFPTVNLLPGENVMLPKNGVYASVTVLPGGERKASVTNIGNRPTFHGESTVVETHILDYSGNLYGEKIVVELLEYLRGEQAFESAEALSAQIAADVAMTKEYFVKKCGTL